MNAEEVPFCDLRHAHAARAAEIEAALIRVARSGRYVLGAEVEAFEREFAARCRAAQAVGVGSGTDAIALILRAAGLGPGDEVVVPAYTAAATWVAVALAGARPVGAEVFTATGLIDPAAAEASIGPRTRALIAVHLFGRLARIDQLRAVADRHGLLLVEDAAHAAGIDEGDGPAGSLADAAAFSFYPTKVLGGLGDGGAVVTDDDDLAGAVRRLRSYGWSEWQGQARSAGANSRLDEIQAAVLRSRLSELPRVQARLRALGATYRRRLEGCPGVSLPSPAPDGAEPAWHQFVIRHDRREAVRGGLAERGIGTAVHYDPLPHRLEAFADHGEFPFAEAFSAQALSLPFDAWLTDAQAAAVCEAVAAVTGSAALSVT